MAPSILELAKELTLALVQTGNITFEDMQDTLQKTYTTLTALKVQEEPGATAPGLAARTTAVDWRKSIRKQAITCLECGQSFKQLTISHLGIHGLDSRSYRMKYAIPDTQPLAARATAERRRQVAQKIRPWEKTPTYRKGQARDGHRSPEPDGEAVSETAEEETVVSTPVQPKRQRTTTPKKKASRKTSVQV
jgi:predicted transcriptional regulator